MKFRNTIILLVVFGALLAYFLLLEKDRNPSESIGTPTPTPTNLFTFASNDVVELDLTDGMTKTTVLKRDNDAAPWKIVAPIEDTGDSVTINGVVQPMSSLSASRIFTDSESTSDLAAFGLAQPKLTITAKLKDGKDYSLRIGDKTPDSTNAYVQKPDDKTIYLINATLVDGASGMLDKPPVAPPTPTPTATATATLTTTVGVNTTPPVTASAPVTGATTIVTGSTTIIVASPTVAVMATPTVTPTTASATSATPIATATPPETPTAAASPTPTAVSATGAPTAAYTPAITATVAITP